MATTTSIDTLVMDAKGGSEAAFTDLLHLLAVRIERQIGKTIGSRNLNMLDDIKQEVAIQLWKDIPRYEKRQREGKDVPFTTWLYVLVNHTTLYYLRSHKPKFETVPLYITDEEGNEVELPIIDKSMDLDTHILSQELDARLARLKLPHLQRQVFDLRRDGLSHEEIAAELGITADYSYVLLGRAQQRIRQVLRLPKPTPKPSPTLPSVAIVLEPDAGVVEAAA